MPDLTLINARGVSEAFSGVETIVAPTSGGGTAFSYCYGLGYIKFESTTPPTVSDSSAWTEIPTDCIIYIPRGALSAYTSATNYPDPSTYTYVEYDL